MLTGSGSVFYSITGDGATAKSHSTDWGSRGSN